MLPAEVADRLRLSVRTVRDLVARGELRGVRVGSRTRIRTSSFVAFAHGHRTRRLA